MVPPHTAPSILVRKHASRFIANVSALDVFIVFDEDADAIAPFEQAWNEHIGSIRAGASVQYAVAYKFSRHA